MIYFLTRRKDHDALIYKSAKITVMDSPSMLEKLMNEHNILNFDTEGSGKRYYVAEPLLIQIGNSDNQIVIDFTEPDELKGWRDAVKRKFNSLIKPEHIFIGHNLKYDHNLLIPYGFKLPDFFDTMIAEQRITMGTGELVNLKDTYERHLKKFFPEDKEIRKQFVGMNKYSIFKIHHIMYAAGDTGDNKDIADKQKAILSSTGQAWFVRNVEFPLVKVLGEIEMEGLDLNSDAWRAMLTTKKKTKLELENKMDSIVRELGKGNMYLTGGRYARERKRATVIQPNLFDSDTIEIDNLNKHNINYNSREQIFSIFRLLNLDPPSVEDKDGEADSLKEEAIQSYLMANPKSPMRPFLESLLDYKGLQKFISSYGQKFLQSVVKKGSKYELGFVNPVTRKVHTVLKQCFTETGRLSSGDKDDGVFNIQNLPAEKEVRQAFTLTPEEIAANYWFTTCDLSGAELIIMAAFADDNHLYELGADKIVDGKKIEADLHSPVATKCWRAVYQYRYSKFKSLYPKEAAKGEAAKESKEWKELFTIHDSKGKSYMLTPDFVVSKEQNKPLRTDFKPMIFGVFYGMMAKKGGETLNIPKDDAQVMIDVIRKEFPKTIKMLEAAVRFAFVHGYVVFNNRSNNRRYFKPVLDLVKDLDRTKYSEEQIFNYVDSKLDFTTKVEITGASLNCRIQGTQADMIKESLVEIRRHPDYDKCKAKLLLSVHDENGCKHIGKEFGEVIKNTMIDVANRYLSPYSATIRMGAEANILHTWTK